MSRAAPTASVQPTQYLWEHPEHTPRVANPDDADFAAGDPQWVRCYPVEVYPLPALPGEPTQPRGDGMKRGAFMAGVRQAAAMIAEAQQLKAAVTCATAIEAEFRPGAPQLNMAEKYLRMVQLAPETLEGFAAVLSDYLAMDTATEPWYYERVQEAQIFGEAS